MQENWEFYGCALEEAPAFVLVDLDVASIAPVADLPFVAFVRVQLPSVGLQISSIVEELGPLSQLEDHLASMLPRTGATRYVGRTTAQGCRCFYFYTAIRAGWEQRVAAVMTQLPGTYAFETGLREDRAWRTYFELLYPDAEDLQQINNRRVCDVLEEHGDAMTVPRDVDHWAHFPDTASRARFLSKLEGLGFTVRCLWDGDEDEARRCGVQFYRVDIPSFTGIDEVTLPLYQAASEAGGEYDGWETQVIKPPLI